MESSIYPGGYLRGGGGGRFQVELGGLYMKLSLKQFVCYRLFSTYTHACLPTYTHACIYMDVGPYDLSLGKFLHY